MKKIIGVIAILLSVVLLLLYRQLTHRPGKTYHPGTYAPATMQENMMLGSLLFQ